MDTYMWIDAGLGLGTMIEAGRRARATASRGDEKKWPERSAGWARTMSRCLTLAPFCTRSLAAIICMLQNA
jgi:hypothetical protein